MINLSEHILIVMDSKQYPYLYQAVHDSMNKIMHVIPIEFSILDINDRVNIDNTNSITIKYVSDVPLCVKCGGSQDIAHSMVHSTNCHIHLSKHVYNSTYDEYTIVLHELLHCMGLYDNSNPKSNMYHIYNGRKRNLSEDVSLELLQNYNNDYTEHSNSE